MGITRLLNTLSVNFSLHSLDVVTSSYDTFVEILRELETRLAWRVEKLDTTSIPIAIQLSSEQCADESIQLRSEYLVGVHESLRSFILLGLFRNSGNLSKVSNSA